MEKTKKQIIIIINEDEEQSSFTMDSKNLQRYEMIGILEVAIHCIKKGLDNKNCKYGKY